MWGQNEEQLPCQWCIFNYDKICSPHRQAGTAHFSTPRERVHFLQDMFCTEFISFRDLNPELLLFIGNRFETIFLVKNIQKNTHDPPAVAQTESSPNLLQKQTDNRQTTTFVSQANGSGASRNNYRFSKRRNTFNTLRINNLLKICVSKTNN